MQHIQFTLFRMCKLFMVLFILSKCWLDFNDESIINTCGVIGNYVFLIIVSKISCVRCVNDTFVLSPHLHVRTVDWMQTRFESVHGWRFFNTHIYTHSTSSKYKPIRYRSALKQSWLKWNCSHLLCTIELAELKTVHKMGFRILWHIL